MGHGDPGRRREHGAEQQNDGQDRQDRFSERAVPFPPGQDEQGARQGKAPAKCGKADRGKSVERQQELEVGTGETAVKNNVMEDQHDQTKHAARKDRPQIAQAPMRKQDDCGAEIIGKDDGQALDPDERRRPHQHRSEEQLRPGRVAPEVARQKPERRDDQQQGKGHPRELKALHQDGGTEQEGRKQEPVEEIPLHHPVQDQAQDERREKNEEDRREVDGPLAENRVKEARHPGKERGRDRIEPAVPGFEKSPRSCKILRLEAEGKSRRVDLEGPVQGEVFHLDIMNAFLVGCEALGRENVKRTRERREDDNEKKPFTGVSFHLSRVRFSTTGTDRAAFRPRPGIFSGTRRGSGD
ncbi:MAG: hypothetical protein A4E67_02374 [Syntrophaceae bacterium PtaB.Bin038]|nr:MAG: hypothetical protein A4E67_02374 [Syntrophaceae bacterium PtaB.Bin038]